MPSYPTDLRKNKHKLSLYYLLALILLISIFVAIRWKLYFLPIVPILGLSGLIFLIKPTWLYFTFVAILPFSVEYTIGSFGLDIPSEPILIGLAVLSTFWFISKFESLSTQFLKNPIIIALILHIAWSFICIFYSSNMLFSLKYALAKYWYVIGNVVGSYWIIYNSRRLKSIISVLLISTTATIVIIMINHGMKGFAFDTIGAACNPLYRNHVIYGVFAVMVFPFIFVLRKLTRKQSIHRLILDVIIVIFLLGIYFTYTRGAWLALPVMLGVGIAIHYKWMKIIYPLSIIAGISFFIYLSHDYKYLDYAPQYENTIYHEELGEHISATFEGKDMSTMERFYRWIAAIRLFKEHPIVGVGPNTFVENYKPYTSTSFETYISDNEERSTVHNYFIYVLAEQGIVGFLIIVSLVGIFFIYSEKN